MDCIVKFNAFQILAISLPPSPFENSLLNAQEHNNDIQLPPSNGQPHTNPEPIKGLLEEMVDSETTKIRLTGNRFATFKYPVKISQKDIEILKKHIEMLELLVE